MRVLIIEQAYDGGHYLNYVRYLVQAFAPLGCEIVVAVPKSALESAQFKMYLWPHRPRFQLEFIPSRKAIGRWRMVASISAEEEDGNCRGNCFFMLLIPPNRRGWMPIQHPAD
jgi:hypothetical protein